MIDTLKLSLKLQGAGMPPTQANKIAEAINEAGADYVTKQDLEVAVSRLEAKISGTESKLEGRISQIVYWVLGSIVLQIVGHFWH